MFFFHFHVVIYNIYIYINSVIILFGILNKSPTMIMTRDIFSIKTHKPVFIYSCITFSLLFLTIYKRELFNNDLNMGQ